MQGGGALQRGGFLRGSRKDPGEDGPGPRLFGCVGLCVLEASGARACDGLQVCAPSRACRAQVDTFEIVTNSPTYLGIRFSMEWRELTIHGHITLINGRCGPVSAATLQRLEGHVAKLFEQDTFLAHVPSKPLMHDGGARRSTFPGPPRPRCDVALIAMLVRIGHRGREWPSALFLLPRSACPA